jgi:anti-sigma factor RsiW
MNTNEAKFILQARRPDGRDDAQAPFSEALAQAARDPVLTGWLAREQAFDLAVTARLREVAPPAGLRDAILAGARMERSTPWWRSGRMLALAASVTLVFGLGVFWSGLRGGPDAERLTAGVMAEMSSPDHVPLALGGRGELRALLADASFRLTSGLPMDFAALKAGGCRQVTIAGRELLEVCFVREGVGEIHLYIARRDDFGGAEFEARPRFREEGTLAAVTWADERLAYVMVSDAGMDALRAVL